MEGIAALIQLSAVHAIWPRCKNIAEPFALFNKPVCVRRTVL